MNVLKYLLLVLFSVGSFLLEAQVNVKKESISSKKSTYDYLEPQITKNEVDINGHLAKARKIKAKNPSKAIALIQEALIASKFNNDNLSEANCYKLLADINYDQKQYDLAVKNYQKSTGLYKLLEDELLYQESFYKEAKSHLKLKQYSEAKNKASTLLLVVEEEKMLSDLEEILGEVAYQSGDYETAIVHFEAQESYEQTLIDKKIGRKLGNAQANLAKVYAAQNDLVNADKKLIESLNSNRQVLDSITFTEVQVRTDQDEDYDLEELEITEESDDYYEAQEQIYENVRVNNFLEQEIDFRNKVILEQEKSAVPNAVLQKQNLGEAYLASKNYEEAVVHLEQSATYAWEDDEIENKAKSLKLLSEALSKSGRNEEALEKYQAYVEAQEKVLANRAKQTLESNQLIAQQNAIEIIEKEFEIYQTELDLLVEQEQSTEDRYKTQKFINYGLLIVLAILAIGSYFIYKSAKEKRKANQMLALKSLRSQMNPHFIFNALNSVNSFISKSDERSANKFLTDFSKLMRMVLDSSHEDLIPLTQELNVIELYLKLEQYRFRDKFDYELLVSDEIEQDSFMIPPMLIQPFIENAVWHGLRYKKTFGKLKVTINELEEQIEVVIEDDGIGRDKSHALKTKNQNQTTSRGLQNTKERIKVINNLYDAKLHLEVNDLMIDQEECGTRIRLIIPKINK